MIAIALILGTVLSQAAQKTADPTNYAAVLSTLQPGETRLTLVECSRRPERKPCEGLLWVTKTEDDYLYAWCPICQEESITISGWQDTLYADGPPEPLPPLPPEKAAILLN